MASIRRNRNWHIGFLLLVTRYKRCSSDEILVVYGRIGGGRASKCIHGGATMVWPLIQDFKKISLTPMTISIPLDNALSLQNIRINVPSTFTVGVSTNPLIMNNAAERLLHLNKNEIEAMAQEIILGQLRLTVASLTIEQINQDRDAFLELIRDNVGAELHKLGLYLINVNIIDITDESNYINSIGKKAAAGAVNKALVDVANAERDGAIGKANADREREVQVAQNVAESEKGQKAAEVDRRVFVQQQEATGVQGENISRAEIAAYQADLEEKEAEAMRRAEVARRTAEMEVQKHNTISNKSVFVLKKSFGKRFRRHRSKLLQKQKQNANAVSPRVRRMLFSLATTLKQKVPRRSLKQRRMVTSNSLRVLAGM